MNNINIFEAASKNKYRYPYKGMITTEDLWDLTSAQLDIVYKALNKGVSEAQVSSLMHKVTEVDAELLNKIEIVKYIFNAKEAEAEARNNDAAKHAKKQRILDILAQKQEDALQRMPEDELKKMLDELG